MMTVVKQLAHNLVADDYFAIQLPVDVTIKGFCRRTRNELCVYHVAGGKIIQEQFFY